MKLHLLMPMLWVWLVVAGNGENLPEKWNTCEVLRNERMEVRLLYRPEASLSDEEWLKLVCKRLGGGDVTIKYGHYRMESERFSPESGERVCSGGLASGGSYDLFGKSATWSADGEIIGAEHPSRYSSCLLGLAPREGQEVRARICMDLDLSDGSRVSTSVDGVPFTFKWVRPDEAGFVRMRQRLRGLMTEPQSESRQCHGYILGALLKVPEVTKDLLLADILAAIDKRSGGFDGREDLVAHLEHRSGDLPEIRNHYLSLLERMDRRASLDLRRASWLWDTRFILPLVALHEREEHSSTTELRVLSEHASEWQKDHEVARRLSAPLLKDPAGVLKRTPEQWVESRELSCWAMFAEKLGHTRDRDVLPLLIPFLDCKAQYMDPKDARSNFNFDAAPYRACDAALNAILLILDVNTTDALNAVMDPAPARTPIEVSVETEWVAYLERMTGFRDKMILNLKARLAAEGMMK